MDLLILFKTLVNVFSVVLHSSLLLIISCTPSLKSGSFDELFFSQNLGDIIAVILRVLTKYIPVLVISNHSGVIEVDRSTFPLATFTNAAEWYSNYVIILSALVFSIDRAVMAMAIRSYSWFCNRVFKTCLVILTWLVPLAWVLPMLDKCCKSQYYGGRIELVEMQLHDTDSTYDAIDMVFETLFYVPVLCILNGFSIVMLYSQWNTLQRKRQESKLKKDIQLQLPTICDVHMLCLDRESAHIFPRTHSVDKDFYENRMLHRLELELSFSMISVIDQQIDFCAVLFYSLYWASYSRYISVEDTPFLEVYSYFFEFGTILTPYILLFFCSDLRKEFFHRLKPTGILDDDEFTE
uniref:7TM_GPCR_Srx domain-containing protein n=1 Tax=Heterorhabditis bacteriophora TaxID=37862 RepID=A0A1I7X7H8_HETBA